MQKNYSVSKISTSIFAARIRRGARPDSYREVEEAQQEIV